MTFICNWMKKEDSKIKLTALTENLENNKTEFENSKPFPHLIVDDFLKRGSQNW